MRGDRKRFVGMAEMPAVSGHELQSLFWKFIGDSQHPREVAAGAVFRHFQEVGSRNRLRLRETTRRAPA